MPATEGEIRIDLAELLPRAARGDMEAFCRVVSAHQTHLLAQAFALCNDQATAEDLAQQTWIEAWKSIPRFGYACRFTTWLYAILLHCHNRIVRQRHKHPIPFASLRSAESDSTNRDLLSEPSNGPGPRETLTQKEQSAEWRRAIEALPEIHRQVVLLRFFEDASIEEIAVITGCAAGTIKTRLHHALNKLRAMKIGTNFSQSRRRI